MSAYAHAPMAIFNRLIPSKHTRRFKAKFSVIFIALALSSANLIFSHIFTLGRSLAFVSYRIVYIRCRLPDKKDSPSPSSRKNMAKHRLRRGHQHAHSVTKRRYDGAPRSTPLCSVRKIEPEAFRSSQYLKQELGDNSFHVEKIRT